MLTGQGATGLDCDWPGESAITEVAGYRTAGLQPGTANHGGSAAQEAQESTP